MGSDIIEYFQNENQFLKTAHVKSIPIFLSQLNLVPKFTITIPTFNRPELLREALESGINQTNFTDYEIIVVDNNPERDCDTEQLMSKYRNTNISYYKNSENIGMFGNWNRCYELARSEWVCMLHDDDKLATSYLNDLYKIIKSKSNIGFISCRLQLLIQSDLKTSIYIMRKFKKCTREVLDVFLPKITKIKDTDYLFGFKTYIVGSCIKREHAIDLGGFNSTTFPSSDYYFTVKFQYEYNNIYFLKKKNYIYRILDNESMNPITSSKFITSDFYFTEYLIKTKKYKFSKLLHFLNRQYVVHRALFRGNAYNVKLDLNKILVELNIQSFHTLFLIRKTSQFIFGLLNMYRSIVKY